MPNLNPVSVTLTINQKVTLHENPQDVAGNPTTPSTSYAWAVGTPSMGTITPSGAANQDAVFVPSGQVGNVAVTATILSPNGNEQSNYNITVTAGPFDHSAPSADAPVAK